MDTLHQAGYLKIGLVGEETPKRSKVELPDALRSSGLQNLCNMLNLRAFVGRIRRSRRIRIRCSMPDALRLSGLQNLLQMLNLHAFVGG